MIQTECEEVEDMEEERDNKEEKEDSDDDINPPLFDSEESVELQVSDLDLESVTPDAPATSTTPSCDAGGRRVIRVL